MNSGSSISPRMNFAAVGVEVVELALEDRDDVAGNVLEDLGILDRAAALLRRGDRSGLHAF